MDKKWEEIFLLHSKSSKFKKRVDNTLEIIKKIFKSFTNISVSYSGGKDSLVMLDICKKINPDVFVWHWDYGIFMPREFENTLCEVLESYFKMSKDRISIDKRYSTSSESIKGYCAFFDTLKYYVKNNNIELSCVGLRKEESLKRRERCKKILEYDSGTQCPLFFPLSDWTYFDIWAYILANKIPYPLSYDIMGKYMGYDQIRFVTFNDPEFENLGSLEQDKFFFWKYSYV